MSDLNKSNGKKTLQTFSLASFLNDAGSDMISPIWPAFATSVLGANMAVLGFIDGLGEAIVSISQAVGGYLSDKYKKRKIFIWLGYVFAGVARVGYAIAQTWQAVIPFRVLDRFGKMRGAPRDAMISELSHDGNRGSNFGVLRSFDNLGALVGIMSALFLVQWLELRSIFLIAAIPSLIAAFMVIRRVPDDGIYTKIHTPFVFKELGRNYNLFLLLSGLFSLGTFSYSFLLIFSQKLEISVIYSPLIYFLFTFVTTMSSLPFGKLSDRIGRKKVVGIGLLLWILMCVAILLSTHNIVWFIIALVLYGLHNAAMDTVQKTLVAELAPEQHRATGIGGFQMVIGLCALPGSLIAGLLWESAGGPAAAFMYSISLATVALLLLLFIREPRLHS